MLMKEWIETKIQKVSKNTDFNTKKQRAMPITSGEPKKYTLYV